MKILATYTGKIRDFRAWINAGMPANVVCLEEYRVKKKTARKRPDRKTPTQIILQKIKEDKLHEKSFVCS